MNEHQIIVGIGEYKTACPPYRIMTVGLGSCIGIAIYDSVNRIGGLAHVMLPTVTAFKNADNCGRFADVAIPFLIESMESIGADRRYMAAKLGGGANMFSVSGRGAAMDIGGENVRMARSILAEYHVRIAGEDVGGNMGRTMILDTDSGNTYIKTVSSGIAQI